MLQLYVVFELIKKLVDDAVVDKYVVWSYARLTKIKEAAESEF